MRLYCFKCGKAVSTQLPEDFIFRGVAECPECITKTNSEPKLKVLFLYRLQDGFTNKYTLSVVQTDPQDLLTYVLYSGWQSSGTPNAISNMQLKKSLPAFHSQMSDEELDKLITKVLNTGVYRIIKVETAIT